MCPACLSSVALLAASGFSQAGWSALVVRLVRIDTSEQWPIPEPAEAMPYDDAHH